SNSKSGSRSGSGTSRRMRCRVGGSGGKPGGPACLAGCSSELMMVVSLVSVVSVGVVGLVGIVTVRLRENSDVSRNADGGTLLLKALKVGPWLGDPTNVAVEVSTSIPEISGRSTVNVARPVGSVWTMMSLAEYQVCPSPKPDGSAAVLAKNSIR